MPAKNKTEMKKSPVAGKTSRAKSKAITAAGFLKNPFVLKCAGVLIIMAALLYGVKRSGVFGLEEVVVVGNKYLSAQTAVELMEVNFGDSLPGISSERVYHRLLASPWVKSLSVRKVLPGSLVVRIIEATPAAVLLKRGRRYLVDEGGTPLERVEADRTGGLPHIAVDPAQRAAYNSALSLAEAVRSSVKGPKDVLIGSEEGGGAESLTLTLDGMLIKIGDGDFAAKLQRFFELEKEIVRRGIKVEYVDVRFANRVVVKPLKEVIR